jgi:aryl sulfotransferase
MLRYFLLVVLGVPILVVLFMMGMFGWQYFNTRGMAYFGRPQSERQRFKRQVARYGRFIRLLLRPLAAYISNPNQFAISHDGVHLPANNCNAKSVAQAVQYAPQPNDLFVVTQMKCGTTWMQQLAYEVLLRGQGDFSDAGHGHLYATSPWLESINGVSVANAPLIGRSQTRLIKTHLPASLCPYSASAKYIYVTRHPASCYRSCVDFFHAATGPLAPPANALLDWFCSDGMWWGSWPGHVAGFWQWAQTRPNVLFVHFEEMKRDLPAVIRRVAAFLQVTLTEAELAQVAEKCSFSYMKAHEEQFEMVPPNFLASGDTFFKSGSLQRHAEVDPAHKARILAFCREKLAGSGYPLAQFYPDVAENGRA